MKKYLLLFALLVFVGLLPGRTLAQTSGQNVLTDIQQKLTWRTPADSVQLVAQALEALRAGKPNAYLSYWGAFAQYHLYFRAGQDKAQAEAALEKGIALLEDLPTKTAEHYALLSLLQGLNLEFANFLTVAFKAATVKENAEKAVAMAPGNLRAHYARGINDYYTPKQYGGGKIAAEHFKKAIEAPEKPDPNPYAPNWGKADAYLYLAQFYQTAGQTDLARKYATEGLRQYPTHARLKGLVAKM
ncbi:MAG: tetratricopeptide repeat protein [Hymenobacter sp.]|nr:tetratricopeptide repeat protein [Hymenobacter sp.]